MGISYMAMLVLNTLLNGQFNSVARASEVKFVAPQTQAQEDQSLQVIGLHLNAYQIPDRPLLQAVWTEGGPR